MSEQKPDYPEFKMPDDPKTASDIPVKPTGEGNTPNIVDPNNSPVPPPPEGKKRILIGIPLLSVSFEFFQSFLKFWTELCSSNPEYEIGYHFEYRRPVHMAEENIIKVAQYNKATHVLFMDDDIFDVTKQMLDKLIEADKDVIGGLMYASKFPHAGCAFRRYDRNKRVIDMPSDNSMFRLYEVPCQCPKCENMLSHWDMTYCPMCGEKQDNLIQRVDLQPFPFTLMKVSIFDKLKYPWFHCTNKYPTDSWFSDRLEEAGLEQHVHMGIRLNHNGVNDQTKPYLLQMGQAKAHAKKGVVSLTPEDLEKHQAALQQKMLEVEKQQKEKPTFVSKDSVVNPPSSDSKDFTFDTKLAMDEEHFRPQPK